MSASDLTPITTEAILFREDGEAAALRLASDGNVRLSDRNIIGKELHAYEEVTREPDSDRERNRIHQRILSESRPGAYDARGFADQMASTRELAEWRSDPEVDDDRLALHQRAERVAKSEGISYSAALMRIAEEGR